MLIDCLQEDGPITGGDGGRGGGRAGRGGLMSGSLGFSFNLFNSPWDPLDINHHFFILGSGI